MSKVFRTLWNHKKKAIFFSGILAWGANYAWEKRRIHQIMRSLCLEAKAFGDRPIPTGQHVRKAVVILNYGAHKSKARKFYENYAAPVLNLAGIQVTIYATDDTTKLREYLEHMENTDALLFAGGDDTIYECIQAYFKLEKPSLSRTPVGILPLGYSNAVYNALRPHNSDEVIKIAQAAMAAAKGSCTPNDVLEIKTADNDEKDYAVSGIQWGAMKDAENMLTKYWYLGPLAPLFTYSLATVKRVLTPVTVSIQYVNACPGCARCEQQQYVVYTAAQAPRTWWQSVIPRKKADVVNEEPQKIPTEVNEDCGVVHDDLITSQDVHILTQNVLPVRSASDSLILAFKRDGNDSLLQKSQQRSRFLNKSDKLANQERYGKRHFSEVRLMPTEADMERHKMVEIDGHNVELKGPLHAKLHSRKLFLFSPETA